MSHNQPRRTLAANAVNSHDQRVRFDLITHPNNANSLLDQITKKRVQIINHLGSGRMVR